MWQSSSDAAADLSPSEAAIPGTFQVAGIAVFSFPNFRLFQMARFCMVLALEMQSVAVGWQIYEITKRPLDLGLVGLAQFLARHFAVPGFRPRRRSLQSPHRAGAVLLRLRAVFHSVVAGGRSRRHVPSGSIYCVLVLIGVVRSFNGPVSRAILPQLVPEDHFPSAVAWASSVFQAATILGPAVGGVAYAAFHGPAVVYARRGRGVQLLRVLATLRIKSQVQSARPRARQPLHRPRRLPLHLARETNPRLDLSRSFRGTAGRRGGLAPGVRAGNSEDRSVGTGTAAQRAGSGRSVPWRSFWRTARMRRKAGTTMLWCVAGFGVFTVIFGISHSLVLSLIALVLVGATDMVSVIVRGTLIQVATPDEMRGRVNAVDMIFIGASNEFGQFESGLTAHWFGTVPAVVLGGIGTLVVTALWAWLFPELRNADRLTDIRRESVPRSRLLLAG